MKKINIDTWYRKEHFDFYTTFKQPFFNVCVTIDVTKTLNHCKENNLSFFICSLFLLGYTANQIEPFRYRINNNEIDVHDELELSCTVLNNDESFSFCEFGLSSNFGLFYQHAVQQMTKIKNGHKTLKPNIAKGNEIFCSVLPWLHFTSISHAQKQSKQDSTPRIVMGKYKAINNEIAMPISVEVHHALVDGIHVGQFIDQLQQNFNHFFNQKN
ncbi:chloramphenicol acetyltransferase [Thalassotalea atypica]|uniref:chloramphenicol acetyltransferase n=1 Tax=Thalassotalea atypica TaxID=2054316 RepID=UPI002573B0DB|nr:chloramphenicol acetyltransferase [Thalassotalea atypica]